MIESIVCYIKAIPLWIRNKCNKDFFIPHKFIEKDLATPAYINRVTNKIRVASGYAHEIDEEYVPYAVFTVRICKCCGYRTATVQTLSEWVNDNETNGTVLVYYERR